MRGGGSGEGAGEAKSRLPRSFLPKRRRRRLPREISYNRIWDFGHARQRWRPGWKGVDRVRRSENGGRRKKSRDLRLARHICSLFRSHSAAAAARVLHGRTKTAAQNVFCLYAHTAGVKFFFHNCVYSATFFPRLHNATPLSRHCSAVSSARPSLLPHRLATRLTNHRSLLNTLCCETYERQNYEITI